MGRRNCKFRLKTGGNSGEKTERFLWKGSLYHERGHVIKRCMEDFLSREELCFYEKKQTVNLPLGGDFENATDNHFYRFSIFL
jgi:hypothetical protein